MSNVIKSPRLVVCAACKLESGTIIMGVRHFDTFMRQHINAIGESAKGAVQGFVDNQRNFLDREQALALAKEAGQIDTFRQKTSPMYELFSEDLY